MKNILSVIMICMCCTCTYAQTSVNVKSSPSKISGSVRDASSGEALIQCSVQLLDSDSTFISGAATDMNGGFAINVSKNGKYILKCSYVGYTDTYKNVEVSGRQKIMPLGTISMSEDAVMLEGAVVKGTIPQVEVVEDTVQYNAAAFRVPEGSVVEELIKKLPGAEVDESGKITINGREISKILVDGKEFFSSQTDMAMKNLPAEIIDKVKTYDKKSDLARITGIDDGEEETVIDLTVKKDKKNGWIGNVRASGGTHSLHSERFNLNHFTDDVKLSLVGSYGNTGNGGTSKRGNTGFNFSTDSEHLETGGNVRYSGASNHSFSESSSERFTGVKSSFSNSRRNNSSSNWNAGGDFRLEWKPDTMNRILFRPRFSFGKNDSYNSGVTATFSGDPYASGTIDDPIDQIESVVDSIRTNLNRSSAKSEGDNLSLGASLMYNRRFGNKGRNLTINVDGGYSSRGNERFNVSDVTYYQRDDSTALTYRYRTTPSSNSNFSAQVTYSEPIARAVFLQFSYKFSYNKQHSDGKAYDLGNIIGIRDSLASMGIGFLPYDYEDWLDEDLSRFTDTENSIHTADFTLRIIREKFNLSAGFTATPQTQRVDYDYQGLDTVAVRHFFNMSPTLNFRYRFSRQHQLRVTYRGRTSQPQITDMFSMTDDSDPLNIRKGNPGLKPSFTHTMNVKYNNYMQETKRNINANVSLNLITNSIANRTEYNEETGGRISQPENINGNWRINADFGFDTPVIWENLLVNTSTSVSHNNNVSFVYQDHNTLKNTVRNTRLRERLDITYRHEIFDVSLNGSVSYTHARSTLVSNSNMDTYDFSYGLSANAQFPFHLYLSTDIRCRSRRGYSNSQMNTDELIWNAQMSYRFLRSRNASVALEFHDILGNRSNISRTITATRRSDSRTDAIYSYVMLSFSYRLNVFGGRFMSSDGGRRRR